MHLATAGVVPGRSILELGISRQRQKCQLGDRETAEEEIKRLPANYATEREWRTYLCLYGIAVSPRWTHLIVTEVLANHTRHSRMVLQTASSNGLFIRE